MTARIVPVGRRVVSIRPRNQVSSANPTTSVRAANAMMARGAVTRMPSDSDSRAIAEGRIKRGTYASRTPVVYPAFPH